MCWVWWCWLKTVQYGDYVYTTDSGASINSFESFDCCKSTDSEEFGDYGESDPRSGDPGE